MNDEFYENSEEIQQLIEKFQYNGHRDYVEHVTQTEINILQRIIGLAIPQVYCPYPIFTWDQTPSFSSTQFWLEISETGGFERSGHYLVIHNEHMETNIGNSYYPLKISLQDHRFSFHGGEREPSEIIIGGAGGKITKIQIWETFFDFKDNTGGSESVICDSALLFFREDGKRFAIKASEDSGSSTELCCSSEEIEEYFFLDDSAKERRLHKEIE